MWGKNVKNKVLCVVKIECFIDILLNPEFLNHSGIIIWGWITVVDGMLQHNGRKLFLCIIEGGSPGLYLLITASTLQGVVLTELFGTF